MTPEQLTEEILLVSEWSRENSENLLKLIQKAKEKWEKEAHKEGYKEACCEAENNYKKWFHPPTP